MADIDRLLVQVNMVHHKGRPDLFKAGHKKYTDDQLRTLIHDDTRPIFVAVNESNHLLGYCFCIFQQHLHDNILTLSLIHISHGHPGRLRHAPPGNPLLPSHSGTLS